MMTMIIIITIIKTNITTKQRRFSVTRIRIFPLFHDIPGWFCSKFH